MINPIYEYYVATISSNLYVLGVDLDDVGSGESVFLNAFTFPVSFESLLGYWAIQRYLSELGMDSGDYELKPSNFWQTDLCEGYSLQESFVNWSWIPLAGELPSHSSPTFKKGKYHFFPNLSNEAEIFYYVECKRSLPRTDFVRAVRVTSPRLGKHFFDATLSANIVIPNHLLVNGRLYPLSQLPEIESVKVTGVDF